MKLAVAKDQLEEAMLLAEQWEMAVEVAILFQPALPLPHLRYHRLIPYSQIEE